MTQDFINYEKRKNDAMLSLVKNLLKEVSEKGIPEGHHFFISFKTDDKAVILSEHLKKKYPEEMTIVLQNQFDHFYVEPTHFSVTLKFNHIAENIVIPFVSITQFYDPYVKFSLIFEPEITHTATNNDKTYEKENDIIILDQFRKK